MNHVTHKSKGCRINLIGGECVECYQDYYLTHNNVCKICPPSFFENFKEENCNITIYSQFCNKYVVKDFPYVKFNSSTIGDVDCTPSIIIFFLPSIIVLAIICCLCKLWKKSREQDVKWNY